MPVQLFYPASACPMILQTSNESLAWFVMQYEESMDPMPVNVGEDLLHSCAHAGCGVVARWLASASFLPPLGGKGIAGGSSRSNSAPLSGRGEICL